MGGMFSTPATTDNRPRLREITAAGLTASGFDRDQAVEVTGANPTITTRLVKGQTSLLSGGVPGTSDKLGG